VLTAVRQWGDQYAAPGGPPLQLVHRQCGAPSEAVFVCSTCGERLEGRAVTVIEGPGHQGGDVLSLRRLATPGA
jgi:hypothetical protein